MTVGWRSELTKLTSGPNLTAAILDMVNIHTLYIAPFFFSFTFPYTIRYHYLKNTFGPNSDDTLNIFNVCSHHKMRINITQFKCLNSFTLFSKGETHFKAQ